MQTVGGGAGEVAHRFDATYVDQMRRLLGRDVADRLAIYPLPDGFRLSVIVPVFNECRTVAAVIDRLIQTGLPIEVLMVDDGSVDGSQGVLAGLAGRSMPPESTIRLLRHPQNRGKGAAIRTALAEVTGDVVVIQDADSEYDPMDFRRMLQPLLSDAADVVYGTRYGHHDRQCSPWWHQAVNGGLSWLASVAIGPRLSDVETCYKMTHRRHYQTILPQLVEERFGIEIEITARLAALKLRFTERPIRYQHRWYDDGKKITWRDGVAAIGCIVRYGFLRQ